MNRKPLTMITDAAVVRSPGRVTRETLVIEGNRINAITSDPPASLLLSEEDVDVISGAGCYLTPGLIDQHFHGGFGCDFNLSQLPDVLRLMAQLPRFGITGAVPTIMTAPQLDMVTAGNTIEEVILLDRPGYCRVLGIHLEGPFLNPQYRGAHPAHDLLPVQLMEVESLISPNVKLLTMAPELDPEGHLIRYLSGRGVQVSAGHSGATTEEIRRGVEQGVRGITHLFNAMRPFHHRDPGIAGVALTDDRLYVEVIGDGHHLHPEAIRMALRAKRPNQVILISDCLALTGLPEGAAITFGQQQVINQGGRALNEEHNLAGSTAFLDQCVRNLVQWNVLRFTDAVHLASTNPAEFLGFGQELGRLEPGYLADMVLWDTETLEPQMTWIDGRLVYSKSPRPQASSYS